MALNTMKNTARGTLFFGIASLKLVMIVFFCL
jgi:hypothetical protein